MRATWRTRRGTTWARWSRGSRWSGDLPSRGLVLKLMDDAPWVISHAVVPLYPKVRTSLTELFLAGTDWVGWLSDTLQLPEKSIRLDARMMRSGDYLAALRRGEPGVLPPGLVARFAREACLSRYVGVVEYSVGDERVADLLWDTTDRVQQGASARLLSGAVLYRDAYRTEFQQLLPSDIAVV